jgi:hypothetical protein
MHGEAGRRVSGTLPTTEGKSRHRPDRRVVALQTLDGDSGRNRRRVLRRPAPRMLPREPRRGDRASSGRGRPATGKVPQMARACV